ncbi:hypothetical protein, partial [Enterobacter cloacae]|uniref:hypothetical protein n=1 Tax=Enterobacter cloacae TaxID=550 RepID=UPI001C111309
PGRRCKSFIFLKQHSSLSVKNYWGSFSPVGEGRGEGNSRPKPDHTCLHARWRCAYRAYKTLLHLYRDTPPKSSTIHRIFIL